MILADPYQDAEKSGGHIIRMQTQNSNSLHHVPTENRDPWLGKGGPGAKQWGIYTPSPNPVKSAFLDIWIPWKLFAFPIVEFAAFVTAWSCSSFLTINLTQSQNFAAPPYNMDGQTIGFMNFAILGGAIIGLITAGPLSDWVSDRATKKNKGIREPEMRLPAMSESLNLFLLPLHIPTFLHSASLPASLHSRSFVFTDVLLLPVPYVLIMMAGNFVVAFGYENKWRWEYIVLIGFTCAGIQVAALPAMVTTYAVDSYKPVAGSVMVAMTVNKNVWGYGFSEFITPWIMKSGFIPPIMSNMSLVTLWCLFGIPFYFFGKTFRRWTKNDSVHKM